MTFSNIEIPVNSYTNPAPNWQIFDGLNIGVIHDGQNRYLILKNLQTAVRFIEPNTSGSDKACILGYNSTNVFFLNFVKNQVRSISTSGTAINESFTNLNEFNVYQNPLLVGTNLTQNLFNATCGNVGNGVIVVGGYITGSTGFTVDGEVVLSNNMCYMYSTDNGATYQGPFFPFYDSVNEEFYNGIPVAVDFIDDNWIWHVTRDFGASDVGANLVVVQTLGVNLIGDDFFTTYLERPNASLAVRQLPFVYFDNKLFYQNTGKTGYYTYDYATDTNSFATLANISNIVQVGSVLRITTLDSCTPVEISATGLVANNIITGLNIGGAYRTLDIVPGITTIVEEGNLDNDLYGGSIDSSHTLQPADILDPFGP